MPSGWGVQNRRRDGLRGTLETVIRRLYVHNFRCLENFTLPLEGQSSVLLIGSNGSGKSTVRKALELLQKIARGTSRVGSLIHASDLSWGRSEVPVRFEIEAVIEGKTYEYSIAFELPPGLKEFRVLEEKLIADGEVQYSRELADIRIIQNAGRTAKDVAFPLDWHLAALPMVQERSQRDPLFLFKRWLARMIILSPVPDLIDGGSSTETLEPDVKGLLFGAWFSGLIAHSPAAYLVIDKYLKDVLPDFVGILNPVSGKDYRKMEVQFEAESGVGFTLPFETLSLGEKCFFLCAMVLAAIRAYGPIVCFWDEPDNHLAISEVGHFVMTLRKAFLSGGGQFIATSHNAEAIRKFSDENTLVLHRANHRTHSTIRPLSELEVHGDLVGALIRGDVEP